MGRVELRRWMLTLSVHLQAGSDRLFDVLCLGGLMLEYRLGFHPYYPERLGYDWLLRLVNPGLGALLRETKRYSLATTRRRVTLYREAVRILREGVLGDFVEIGVHRGGTAAVLAFALRGTGRSLHLFDRWGDLPEPTERDGFRQQQYRRDAIGEKLRDLAEHPPLRDAKRLVQEVAGYPEELTFYYEGWYQDTLRAGGPFRGSRLAFASVDCDYYESVRLALQFVQRHASPRATIVVDDYGSWPGAQDALLEYVEESRRGATLTVLKRLGQAVLRLGG